MNAFIDTVMLTALIGGVLALVIGVAHWIGLADWFMNRTLRNETPRVRPPRAEPISLDLDRHHPTGRPAALVALARENYFPTPENEDRDVHSARPSRPARSIHASNNE